MKRFWFGLIAAVVATPAVMGMICATAQDAVPAARIVPAGATANDAADEAPAVDPFAVPETGTAEEYAEFLGKLAGTQPTTPLRSMADLIAFQGNLCTAGAGAADKLLDAKPNEAQAMVALGWLQRAGNMMPNVLSDDENAAFQAKYIAPLADRLTALGFEKAAREAKRGAVLAQIAMPNRQMTEEEQAAAEKIFPKVKADTFAFIAGSPEMTTDDAVMFSRLGSIADRVFAYKNEPTAEDGETLAALYTEMAAAMRAAKNPAFDRQAKVFTGNARRLGSVGKVLELRGIGLDGKPFDIESLRGKVVLVDFWATWCGPCIAEAQNIHKAYDQYAAKGFEVVGVSVDRDREALEKYLETAKYPWIVTWDPALNEEANKDLPEDAEKKDVSMASHYGVNAIPTVILVGKDGKVVTLSSRGEDLFKNLQKLLGDPIVTEDAAE